MPVPNVKVKKNAFALAAIPPSVDGILAIFASSSIALPAIAGYGDPGILAAAAGSGTLPEYGALVMDAAGRSVVAGTPTTSVAATYSAITYTGTGTLAPAAGATHPYEHYAVLVQFPTGGTVGVTGITFLASLDGGNTFINNGLPASLGTATTLTIPNSGVSFTLTAAQTIVAGDSFVCYTERPLMSDSDCTSALNALALARLAWEMVLLDTNIGAATVGVVDTILAGWEAKGSFKIALLNTRWKNEPSPATESEASYLTAMTTVVGSQVSQRLCVGTDGAHIPSPLTGYNLKRPSSIALAMQAMSVVPNIGTDPAYVGNGPVQGAQIADAKGNPLDHDEDLYPGLDDVGLVALRSFAPGGPVGVYINNANVLSGGSNIKYLQQLRVMNKACGICWSILSRILSLGVRTTVNQQTGLTNIAEIDAQKIDELVNPAVSGALLGQVQTVLFATSRTDPLAQNAANIITATVEIVGFIYVKGFAVTVAFAKSISVAGT